MIFNAWLSGYFFLTALHGMGNSKWAYAVLSVILFALHLWFAFKEREIYKIKIEIEQLHNLNKTLSNYEEKDNDNT